MARPIVYDITHLLHRLPNPTPSGIDHVDLQFARFALRPKPVVASVVRYGLLSPTVYSTQHGQKILADVELARLDKATGSEDPVFGALRHALLKHMPTRRIDVRRVARSPLIQARLKALRILRKATTGATKIPVGAIYLNIAQHALEYGFFLRWLKRRSDVKPVFFVHDLLPLDNPEYWRAGYKKLFNRRVETIFRHAKALIVSTECVAQRVRQELQTRGKPQLPIHVAPLPSPIEGEEAAHYFDPELAAVPYFLIVGTIEPRKNHLLLLDVWRSLAERGGAVPKLVIIGARGWENEQTFDALDRSVLLKPHVIEASGLSTDGMRRMVVNARAVLMPSFDEGYGLPLVEALSLRTPVIASDIPVFREVTQGKACFLSPLDGIGWRDAVCAYTAGGAAYEKARAQAASFLPPSVADYNRALTNFLQSL